MLPKSQSTTAAVRQYEMKLNITLPTTMTCVARASRPSASRPESKAVRRLENESNFAEKL